MTKHKTNIQQFWEITIDANANNELKINCLGEKLTAELMRLYTIEPMCHFNKVRHSNKVCHFDENENSFANCKFPILIFTAPNNFSSIILIFPNIANFNSMKLAQLEPLIHQINNSNDKIADLYDVEIAQLVTNAKANIQ
jgi:hypothetical protein